MQRLQAFKYELKPTGEQQRDMRRFAGSCRVVYNEALALQAARYERSEKKLGYAGLCKELTAWRNGAPLPSGRVASWLAESPVHPLQQALKDLERAYANFFAKRAAFPRRKKKGQHDSFRYPDPKQIKLDQANSRIFLPKLGWLRYRNSRDVLGEVRNATVSLSGGKWSVSIQTAREVTEPVPRDIKAVGIDVGIARFATMSDGGHFEPLNSFKRHEARLHRAQRAMSRKTKFSSNWKKAKARVQRIHTRIGNARRDYLHKVTTTISNNHAMVSIEDLKVRNMSRSAAGSVEAPGKNVKAKSGLNRSILDQGWFEFRRQLEYKLEWNGGWLIAVPPQNTSRTCPACGCVSADNRTTQAKFACVACGYKAHADVVGARNILTRGLQLLEGQDNARIACGEMAQSGHSVKQEPAYKDFPFFASSGFIHPFV
ncbi:RNA-guided endonuclease InsQ/TnpB family protein [Paraburkholderia terrae]